MRVLITGEKGQLARALRATRPSVEAHFLGRSAFPVTDPLAWREVLRRWRPDAVIHLAAITDVDACEEDPTKAYEVHARAVLWFAEAAEELRLRVRLVYVSTDYVFPGTERKALEEYARPAPLQVYGASKLAGELLALEQEESIVLRTSFLFWGRGPNILWRLAEALRRLPEVRLVEDQWIVPTDALDCARALWTMLTKELPGGIWHYAGPETVTPWELGQHLQMLLGTRAQLRRARFREFARKARRPQWNWLKCERAQKWKLPAPAPWREGVARWKERLQNERNSA